MVQKIQAFIRSENKVEDRITNYTENDINYKRCLITDLRAVVKSIIRFFQRKLNNFSPFSKEQKNKSFFIYKMNIFKS